MSNRTSRIHDYCKPAGYPEIHDQSTVNVYKRGDELLAKILHPTPGVPPSDALYAQILSSFPYSRNYVHILHAATWGLCPEDMDKVLAPILRDNLTSRPVLSSLSALIKIPAIKSIFPRGTVEVLHTSFLDYLTQEERSGRFWINAPEIRKDVYDCVFTFLSTPRPLEMAHNPFPDSRITLWFQQSSLGAALFEPSDARIQNPVFIQSLSITLSTGIGRPSHFFFTFENVRKCIEDFKFADALCDRLWKTQDHKIPSPYPTVDTAYHNLLSKPLHAKLLGYLRLLLVWSERTDPEGYGYDGTVHEHLNVDWIDMLPLCELLRQFKANEEEKDYLPGPFLPGSSPLDFLADKERAGALYRPIDVLQDEAALSMIQHMKALVKCQHPCEWYLLGGWAELIIQSRSHDVFLEFSTLNISSFCPTTSDDPKGHCQMHVRKGAFEEILKWLKLFPTDEAKPVLKSWTAQMAAAERCYRRSRRSAKKLEHDCRDREIVYAPEITEGDHKEDTQSQRYCQDERMDDAGSEAVSEGEEESRDSISEAQEAGDDDDEMEDDDMYAANQPPALRGFRCIGE
ncbi:hypothetical protein C8J57DRAFT_1706371 [Mycena rebaudengoi]|nr:hypothetical protein C8J57DRAFT_1706371 [Mycena rebaudengoi]